LSSRGAKGVVLTLATLAIWLAAATAAQAATIIVKLDSDPDDAQAFSYTTGGGLPVETFTLRDQFGAPSQRTLTGVPAGSGYSLTQDPVPGWTLASATCSNGSSPSNITVAQSDTISCTFKNTLDDAGHLTLVLDAQPDASSRFLFRVSGPSPYGGILLQDNGNEADGILKQHTVGVREGLYSITLRDLDDGNWTNASSVCSDGSPITSVLVSAQENVTCTLTYQTISTVTVLLDSRPNSSQAFNFSYKAPGQSAVNFSLTDGSGGMPTRTFVASPGSGFSVVQNGVPTGFDLTSMTCDDGSPPDNITVEANENITCAFVNDKRPTLRVVLDAQPESTQQFSFTAGGGLSPNSFTLAEPTPNSGNLRTFADIAPGTYSLSQATATGWDAPVTSCSDGSPVSAIDASYGETITCTFTNRQTNPGHLTLRLDATPDDESRFVFRVAGPQPYGGIVLQDDGDPDDGSGFLPQHTVSVVAGTYAVQMRQAEFGTWRPQSATCSDGSSITSIQISSSEDVTCTLVEEKVSNTRDNILTAFEDSPCGATFRYTMSRYGDFDLTCTQNTLSVSLNDAGPGYWITPSPPPSTWVLTSASCDDGSPISNIDVGLGESVKCTFRHQQWGQVIAILDAQPDSSQSFSYTAGGGLSPTSFTLSDPSPGNTAFRSRTLARVPPGSSYTLSQVAQAGWDLTSATCDNGSPVTNISVPLGATVRCTFTNVQQPPG
jgi:hypothetical protein